MIDGSGSVLRWEWRQFGNAFDAVEAQLRSAVHDLKVTSETYVVCRTSNANAKIRGGQLDVKLLERIDRGLELWRPALKARFPIDPDAIATLFGYWGLVPPTLDRTPYTSDEFLDDVVAITPELTAVPVTKERLSATIDGCTVEVATLTIDRGLTRTVAVESAIADDVLRVVRALGFSPADNASYVTALKRRLGIPVVPAGRRA